jgi:phosphate-selective porin
MDSNTRARHRPVAPMIWLALAGAISVAAGARPVRAEEQQWPPSTPPRVDLRPDGTAQPAPPPPPTIVEPLPAAAPEPEPSKPAPEPSTPAPAPAAPPPVESRPAVSSSSADETLVHVATPEPPRGQLSYGSKDGQLYLRTAYDEVVLLPSLQLDFDANSSSTFYASLNKSDATFSRARLDVAGWAYSKVFVNLAADFANGPSLRHVDNYVAVAPWGDRVILQLGQFDAPFTLENRTSDRYLDFIDRGAAVRAFAIPENKDQGAMVHGTNPAQNFYYSAAVMNGEGPTVSRVDSRFDVMARGWIAPFSFHDPEGLRSVTVGGSAWTGDRSAGPYLEPQTTQAGQTTLDPSVFWTMPPATPVKVREQGRLRAFALELNAPFLDRFGLRFEWITKRQPLSAYDFADANHPMLVAGLTLSGFSTYGEVWAWVLGDSRMLGVPAAPGLELPLRYRDLQANSKQHGLMLAARVDYIDEKMSLGPSARMNGLGVSAAGSTKLTAYTFGATYWFTRRARLNLNYVLNRIDGTTPFVLGLQTKSEHEVMVRTSLAL